MKKKSLLITVIALIAIVATMAISFAAWSTLDGKGNLDITIGDKINLEAAVTANSGKASLIPADAVKAGADDYTSKLGTLMAQFKSDSTVVAAATIDCSIQSIVIPADGAAEAITIALTDFYTYFTITLKADTKADIVLATATQNVTIESGVTYDVVLAFNFDNAGYTTELAEAMATANLADISNLNITLFLNTVLA